MLAKQLGGEIKYLSQGEIEARNRGYSPYSVEACRQGEQLTELLVGEDAASRHGGLSQIE
jgi:hypothetical protein